jgi:hypothetical protein
MVDLVRLRQEVESLQLDCQRMYQELDDQAATADHRIPPTSSSFPQSNVRVRVNEEEEDDVAGWDCGTCTFKNHVALLRCEECDMPRPVLSLADRNNIRPDPVSVMVTTEESGNHRTNTSPTGQRQPPPPGRLYSCIRFVIPCSLLSHSLWITEVRSPLRFFPDTLFDRPYLLVAF